MNNLDYIDLKFDIFEYAGQRARVRKSLLVRTLIDEILREFNDIPDDSPENYAIYLKGTEQPLDEKLSLAELDIQPHDELIFDHFRKFIRKMLDLENYASVIEESSGKAFDIQWQPAVIGRPSTDMDHNIMLAVNLQLLPDGITISRRHAQISFSEGRHYLERLAENNPVFLNGKEVPPKKKTEVKNKDRLQLGPRRVSLIFEKQPEKSKTKPKTSSSQIKSAKSEELEPQKTVLGDLPELAFEIASVSLELNSASTTENTGKTIAINTFPFKLGRGIPLLINEGQVSREHAEITLGEDRKRLFITDLESTNGVRVNGKWIEPNTPVEIKHGAVLGLGNVVLFSIKIHQG
jgi:pSer/pThr/pTyr-binding forkhead associated (FHA) protein